jgi:hypothetical protein
MAHRGSLVGVNAVSRKDSHSVLELRSLEVNLEG